MIGNSLGQLALRFGMQLGHGAAYGNVMGYAVTLGEGNGSVTLSVSTTFPDPTQKDRLEQMLQQFDLGHTYHLQSMAFGEKFLQFRFHSTADTLFKLDSFIRWLLPWLRQYGAVGAEICTACGNPLNGEGQWKLIDGTAHCFHDACARRLRQSFTVSNPNAGSLFWGILGAFLGALLGGVLWGTALIWGYLVPVLGFFIGWLAGMGYDLLQGKPGKIKTLVLLPVTLCGALLVYLAAVSISFAIELWGNPAAGALYGNIPMWVLRAVFTNWRQFGQLLLRLVPSLAFAIVGIFVRSPKQRSNTPDSKMIDLP